jgi:hypothetical protein
MQQLAQGDGRRIGFLLRRREARRTAASSLDREQRPIEPWGRAATEGGPAPDNRRLNGEYADRYQQRYERHIEKLAPSARG